MSAPPPRLLVARGARHAEQLLLAEALRGGAAPTARDDALDERLAVPLHVVVPSQSLRLHVLERLVRAADSSVVGIHCHTHYGMALQVLDGLGIAPPRGLDLFPILARRFARREESLAAALDHLREGYSGILPAVRDLLDAGFDAAHLDAFGDALSEEDGVSTASDEIARAQALGRVTARTLLAFEELGVGRVSTLLQAATEGVKSRPEAALASRGVLLHGFADATGVATDFLTALLEAYGGSIIVDRPPDPVRPADEDPSSEFTARLAERFRGFCDLDTPGARLEPPRIELFRALGEESELREVGQRCLDLIDEGEPPESIAVVMREPRPYRSLVRRVFDDLALPYSSIGLAAPVGPVGRRIRAWLEMVGQGSSCHVERWLDALPDRFEGVPLFDLRVALAALGVSRLDQLAGLELDEILSGASYPLPVRQGFSEADEEVEGGTVVRARRRHVPGTALRALVAAGRGLARVLEAWDGAAMPLDRHVDELRRVTLELGWSEERPEGRRLADLFERLAAAPPVAVDREEMLLTVRRLAAELDREPLGGRGGGVRVMGVVEARGLTFGHLFVLGMNRGVFPRTVREDPVLSDSLRQRLARAGHGLLPNLPIKRRGFQEERYLFAHLLSAAPHVVLSWLDLDDEDRPLAASPLVERLRWSHAPDAAAWRQPPVAGRHPLIDHDAGSVPPRRASRLSPREQLVLAALDGPRQQLPSLFASIFSQRAADRAEAEIDWQRVARARRAVIDELDPPGFEAAQSCLSPYLGFIGAAGAAGDPRNNRRLYVTTVERMATCPWQTLLERLLRVEAVPDPLEALPQIDPLMIGVVVHRVLEQIVTSSLDAEAAADPPAQLEELLGRSPQRVVWPDEARLDEIVDAQAAATVRASGVALEGFSRALAAVAHPYLEMARRIAWKEAGISTLGAEVRGTVAAPTAGDGDRLIAFRADRVDRRDGQTVLIDYKTGGSPYTQLQARNRRQAYLRDLAAGGRLQPAVYAAAVATTGGEGRFSFLRPHLEIAPEARRIAVTSDDEEARRALDRVLVTVLDAWDRGLFFPRLELPQGVAKPPPACKWCRVAEACLRQDSGARRRLRLGMERLRSRASDLDGETRAALLEQWFLATPEHRPSDLAAEDR